jgi:gamma-glutamyltranspeptidase/glutathione hydrolase
VSFEWGAPSLGVEGYSNQTTAFFKEVGKNISFIAPGSSTMQAIRVLLNGTFEAAGEPRQVNSGGLAV